MVKSYRGKEVDMNRISKENEDSIALGNMRVNARGDKLGRGGKVIKTNEERVRDYYSNNPKGVKKVDLRAAKNEFVEEKKTPDPTPTQKPKSTRKSTKKEEKKEDTYEGNHSDQDDLDQA